MPLDRTGIFVDAKIHSRSGVQVQQEAGLVARDTSGRLGIEHELETARRTGPRDSWREIADGELPLDETWEDCVEASFVPEDDAQLVD